MKRVREEEGEEEEEQQQKKVALMAWSPTPNPVLATAATPSESGDQRVTTILDAVDFMSSVKRTFVRSKYNEFLDILNPRNSIGLSGIVNRMKGLLRGYPDLKRGFNKFLPTQYQLSLRDDD